MPFPVPACAVPTLRAYVAPGPHHAQSVPVHTATLHCHVASLSLQGSWLPGQGRQHPPSPHRIMHAPIGHHPCLCTASLHCHFSSVSLYPTLQSSCLLGQGRQAPRPPSPHHHPPCQPHAELSAAGCQAKNVKLSSLVPLPSLAYSRRALCCRLPGQGRTAPPLSPLIIAPLPARTHSRRALCRRLPGQGRQGLPALRRGALRGPRGTAGSTRRG